MSSPSKSEYLRLNLETLKEEIRSKTAYGGYKLGSVTHKNKEEFEEALKGITKKEDAINELAEARKREDEFLIKFLDFKTEFKRQKEKLEELEGENAEFKNEEFKEFLGKEEQEVKVPEGIEMIAKMFGQTIEGLRFSLEQMKSETNKNSRKMFKLDPKLPCYSGKWSENLDEWVFVIENYRRLNKLDDVETAHIIAPLLKDNALQVYMRHMRSIDSSWSNLIKELRRFTQPENRERKLRVELMHLKQEGDFEKFLLKFRSIINQLSLPDNEALFIFTEALKPNCKKEVLARRVRTLQGAIEAASIFEESFLGARNGETSIVKKINYDMTRHHFSF